MQPRAATFGLWIAAASVFMGCAGHAGRTIEARNALDAKQPQLALDLYNEALDVDKGSELPTGDEDDHALLLLDRSLIHQQLQNYEDSSRDLETADKKVEMLDFTRSTADEIGRYLFSDDTGPYKARPFEKLLVNTMNMLNYLARGNLSGAKVEARRFSVMQKYLKESEDLSSAALMGPGSYFAGFIFEKAGDPNEAIRYYDEALLAGPYASLADPVRRMAARSGYRSPRITPLVEAGQAQSDENTGEVLVVVSYGRVPALRANRMPIGLALTYAGTALGPGQEVAARRMMGQGLVTWVNFPELEEARYTYGTPDLAIDGRPVNVDQVTSVDSLVRAAYERVKGPIIASAITRMVTRGAIGAAAGVAAAKGSNSGPLGMILALGTQASLAAADTPDTRCWATLPARIAIARVLLPAGKHRVQLSVLGVKRSEEVEVRPGGFAVINLTELSQR